MPHRPLARQHPAVLEPFRLATDCDPAPSENASINFNAGDHSVSIEMTCADYLAVEKPAQDQRHLTRSPDLPFFWLAT